MRGGAVTPPAAGRPLIIPVFIPHRGCPHRCVFCNQRTIARNHASPLSIEAVTSEIQQFMKFAKRRYTSTQISFFGGTFLGLDETMLRRLLTTATTFVKKGQVSSLRFSTRPDTIDAKSLSILAKFPVSTVELGVQSMNDRVLDAAGRGHRAADTMEATARLKAAGYEVGLQMMVGLPGDDDAGAMSTAFQIAALKPDFVRIYPTLVLAGSPLAKLFRRGAYRPMDLDPCVTLVKRLYLLFKGHGIPVVRMGLQASDGLADRSAMLAGPYHPAFGHLVHGEIVRDAICDELGRTSGVSEPLTISVHPTMVSRVQGLNKRNLHYFQEHFGIHTITLVQDDTLTPDRLTVGGRRVRLAAG